MFSDLVGSTALSARMDPEDLREVISAYQKCVAETVQRFGGFVAKYMGDGVLVYFGYPQAHEHDAERAVRAGLELVGAVTALKASAPLQTRVGVATGLVVVGDLIGAGSAQEQTVVGDTPNLAARLQGIAEPNMVVIAVLGQRKSEVAEAQWSEFDVARKIWTIPAERMKADAAHIVPLSDDALEILKALPSFDGRDYLFSATFGKKPVNGFSKAKMILDREMLKVLREGDPKAELADFVIHDIRRTVRTGLSAIPNISDLVRELVIGHTKPGLHKVYDQHVYLDEKRFALDAWAARLRSISR
jgi:hypothetical protein